MASESAPTTEEAYPEPDILIRSPSISPQFEIDDPLTQHWQQSPKRSSFIIRRLSRSTNRRSLSFPCEAASMPPTEHWMEEEDVVYVSQQFQQGVEMLRVTRKKVTKRICWIDPVTACVGWDSKNSSKRTVNSQMSLMIVYIDNIKALHSAAEARHYREQFQLSAVHEATWITIIYTAGSKLKALHLIASTVAEHDSWLKTLKNLRRYRKEVTGSLAFLMSPERKLNPEKSVRAIRRHWREAGGKELSEVSFAEVERLCWRLNVHLSSKYLRAKFDVPPEHHAVD